jgi:DNA processing protein
MQQFTFTNNYNFSKKTQVISPVNEAAAYEALWTHNNVDSFAKISKIFKKYSNDASPYEIFKNTLCEKEFTLTRKFRIDLENSLQKIKNNLLKILEEFNDIEICINETLDYPKKLLDAKDPIKILYYQGNWELAFAPSLAVVGTRNPSESGIKNTKDLVKFLVKKNFTIASGLAKGIDTVAHKTAIEEGGQTFAVIGTPLSEVYPKENAKLQEQIRRDFLLISQIPFIKYNLQDYRKNRWFFPERNKTMSALTLGTVIVEASETSGTLVQAKAALEQGRKLFILDSCFSNKNLTWPEKFQKKGAIRIKSFDDIEHCLTSSNNKFDENADS